MNVKCHWVWYFDDQYCLEITEVHQHCVKLSTILESETLFLRLKHNPMSADVSGAPSLLT